jgi:hypothetical protein
VIEHRSAESAAARGLGCVHRFQLGVLVVERLDCAYGEEFAIDAQPVERHRRIC